MFRNQMWRTTSLLVWDPLATVICSESIKNRNGIFIPINFDFTRIRFNNEVMSIFSLLKINKSITSCRP